MMHLFGLRLQNISKTFTMALPAAALLLGSAQPARAGFVQVDLANYVNLGFQNSWFINGNQFSGIIGSTTGNQGSTIPFTVANTPDNSGQGGDDNFWYGLWGGSGNQLDGSPLSITIPINQAGVTNVYTLADNTFGGAGNLEFSVTFMSVSGSPLTEKYTGANNTKDYNKNCGTTGCSATPNAANWFVDAWGGQGLQVVDWTLPANFGTLSSITISQVSGSDGAIIAGLTLLTDPNDPPAAVPEPEGLALTSVGIGLVGVALLLRRSRLKSGAK
jgi:hypothetical protein